MPQALPGCALKASRGQSVQRSDFASPSIDAIRANRRVFLSTARSGSVCVTSPAFVPAGSNSRRAFDKAVPIPISSAPYLDGITHFSLRKSEFRGVLQQVVDDPHLQWNLGRRILRKSARESFLQFSDCDNNLVHGIFGDGSPRTLSSRRLLHWSAFSLLRKLLFQCGRFLKPIAAYPWKSCAHSSSRQNRATPASLPASLDIRCSRRGAFAKRDCVRAVSRGAVACRVNTPPLNLAVPGSSCREVPDFPKRRLYVVALVKAFLLLACMKPYASVAVLSAFSATCFADFLSAAYATLAASPAVKLDFHRARTASLPGSEFFDRWSKNAFVSIGCSSSDVLAASANSACALDTI